MASFKCCYFTRFLCVNVLLFCCLILILMLMIYSNLEEFQTKVFQFEYRPIYNSTCSRFADDRGPHQKVVSYSLYGNFSREDIVQKYLTPLKKTIGLISNIYPGWVVRIYHNQTSDSKLKLLADNHVDFCNVTEIIKSRKLGDLFAMTWRWLPLLDEMVDVIISRDSDGMIVSREEDAVREWLESDKTFHLMRDHPAHCLFGFILGGLWGVKVNQDRQMIVLAAKVMFNGNHQHEYDHDQILLDKFIWPIAKKNSMTHDSFCCEKIQNTQPFPKQRRGRIFVGARWVGPKFIPEELSEIDECPRKCRLPSNQTSEWNYC